MIEGIRTNRRFYLVIGDGANSTAHAPMAAEPNAIKPSGMVAAVLKLKMQLTCVISKSVTPDKILFSLHANRENPKKRSFYRGLCKE